MNIENLLDSNSNEPYFIAETAFSHEGSMEYMRHMIDQMKDTTNIAIKFQILIDKTEFLTPSNRIYEVIDKWLFNEYQWAELIEYADSAKVPIILAILDKGGLDLAISLRHKVAAIEVHPSCIPDVDFMQNVAQFCKTESKLLIIGISGFSFDEISYMLNKYLKHLNRNQLLFMYGFQNYPTKVTSLSLKRARLFSEKCQIKVAYADHTEYNDDIKDLLITSVYAAGINIIELHYVLEYGVERTDYVTAYDAARIISLQERLSLIKQVLWENNEAMSTPEEDYSMKFRKTPVYCTDLMKGHVLTLDDIKFKRSNKFIKLLLPEIEHIVGKKIKENVATDQVIDLGKLE